MPSHVERFQDRGGQKNDTGAVTDRRGFLVAMDSKTDSGVDVLNYVVATIGVNIGTAHPDEPLMVCNSIDYKPHAGAIYWHVTCNYTTQAADPDDSESDPTNMGVRKSWGTVKEESILEEDLDGNPVVNKANQPFVDPPVTRTRSRIKWTYQRYETLSDAAFDTLMETYIDTVNSAVFNGKAAGEVYCDDITGERVWQNNTLYRLVTYVFIHDPDGFQATPMNAGYMCFETPVGGGDDKLVKCKDQEKEPVTSPYPLDNDGKQIAAANLPADILYLTFKRYEESDFSVLGLV